MVFARQLVGVERPPGDIFPKLIAHPVVPLLLLDVVDRQLDSIVVGVAIVQRQRQAVMDRDSGGYPRGLETLVSADPIGEGRIEECKVIDARTARWCFDQSGDLSDSNATMLFL